jgi:hypothetical protein
MEIRGLSVSTSTAIKEKRLQTLLGGRGLDDPRLAQALEDAQIAGSLALADQGGTEAADRLRAAQRAVAPGTAFTVELLRTWHSAVVGAPSRWRTTASEAPTAAPPEFVESRLTILEQWLRAESRRQLKPAQAGALVMARVLEIRPFDEGNGRVARLAASHLMVEGGARPPIWIAADRQGLESALQAAFQLVTEPLSTVLEAASDRALDVMIQALS